jgi:NADH dehydrogenase FAD-containing subunit
LIQLLKGSYVTTSLLATGVWSASVFIQAALCGASFNGLHDRAHPANAGLNTYRSSDGTWFVLVVTPDKVPAVLKALCREDILTDPRFSNPAKLEQNRPQLTALLDEIFGSQPMSHWYEVFNDVHVPFGAGSVNGIDPATRHVIVDAGDNKGLRVAYDYLVLATGATHSYFGHDEFAYFAPGLKSLADAESLRNHILTAFENEEVEENPERRKALMTFVMVGAGPTGVEMASAIAIMVRTTLQKNFCRIDPKSAHIILVDMAKRPLGTFAESLSEAARLRLLQLGVDVRLEKAVQTIDGEGAVVGDERIPSKTVIWTAGVAPSPAGKWLGCEVDRAGRVRIRPDLTVQDHPEIFVIGVTASLDQDGRPLPGVAQVAMQQGRYAAKSIFRQVT